MPGRERIFSLTTGGAVQNRHNQENSCGSQQDAHPRADAGAFGDSPDHGRGHNRADPRQGDKDAHGERVAAKDVTGICDSRAVHAGEGKPQSDSTGQHQGKAVCEQDDAEKGENTRGQDPDDDSGGNEGSRDSTDGKKAVQPKQRGFFTCEPGQAVPLWLPARPNNVFSGDVFLYNLWLRRR